MFNHFHAIGDLFLLGEGEREGGGRRGGEGEEKGRGKQGKGLLDSNERRWETEQGVRPLTGGGVA